MKILFVCTGNTCRSPMAEGIARIIFPGDYNIASAGLNAFPGDVVNAKAISALANKGINISTHKARKITKRLLEDSDLIVTMTRAQKHHLWLMYPELKERIVLLGEWVGLDKEVSDPWGGPPALYEQCADEIELLLKAAAENIMKRQ